MTRTQFLTRLVLLLSLTGTSQASIRSHQELRDLFYGEILFHAYQQDYFEAISHIDTELAQYYALDEPELDPFDFHRGQAEFAVGDLELLRCDRPDLGFEAAAMAAVRQWRYVPARLDGRPVDVYFTVFVSFDLL